MSEEKNQVNICKVIESKEKDTKVVVSDGDGIYITCAPKNIGDALSGLERSKDVRRQKWKA